MPIRSVFRIWPALALLLVVPAAASAQATSVPNRITQAVDETRLTVLPGNTHPFARPEFDRGAAPASQPTRRMQLVLQRSPAQETALEALLAAQQNKSSASYHQWLTPAQFGQQFGPSDQDIQTVTSWLGSHGFQVAGVSSGRTVIEFSGTAGEIQEAFHTAIHKYVVNGEEHWANSSDPQIPTALTPVVAGVATLHNFPRGQMHEVVGNFSRTAKTGAITPLAPRTSSSSQFTISLNGNIFLALGPADFAKIYNVPNLILSPPPAIQLNGDGETIAVLGQSNINPQDVSDFRNLFGLPAPKLNVIVSGSDPLLNDAETEADLDVQWTGAVAPNATIDLVIAGDTEVSLGVDLAAQYAVDNNIAPVLNESFGLCEFFIGTSGNTFYNQVWQQAAAQGITVTVSSGDQGSAACDRGQQTASFGLAVSGFTSTPYNVSVGGTDFNDINSFSTFWNTTPSDTPTVPSAKSYIPEMTWNDSCTNQEIFSFFGVTTAEQACNNISVQQDGLVFVTGGSGGKSSCTTSDGQNENTCSGGYAKPSWQTALTPTDGQRDIPDVSLYASNGFNASFYIVCEKDLVPDATSCDPFAPVSDFVGIGGTSASSPAFAGILALVNQKTGSRQGNANYVLYQLAAKAGNSCTSAANPSSACVFYDVPAGSTIAMPCEPGSLNCTSSGSDTVGVLTGYATGSGYDLATGLGSVNANNLVNAWETADTNLKTSTTSLTLNSGAAINGIPHGQSVSVDIGVAGSGGTPSGNVSLIANMAPPTAPAEVTQQGVQGFILSGGSVSSSTNVLPGGNYNVFARYVGDGTFGPSDSIPVNVAIAPEASQSNFAFELFNPSTGLQTNPNATSAQYGSLALLRVNVTSHSGDTCAQNAPGQLGCPTGSVTITNNGIPLNAGTYPLNSQGYAEDQTVQLPGGTNMLQVTYAGDNSFNASAGADTITITKAPTTISASSPFSDVMLGGFNTLNANINSVGLGAGPTGQVTFFSGTAQLGNPVSVTNSTAGGFNSAPQAQATITTSQLPLGNNSITALYSGDGNYATANSSPITVDVQILTGCFISTSNLTINYGSSVTFTAQVTATQSSGPGPTGTVTFSNGSFTTLATVPLTNGQAQFTTSTLPGGNDQINAQYSGDANYTGSASSLVETVNLLATSTSLMTSNPTIQQGSSVTLTATVAPIQSGGPALTGTVQFFYDFNPQGSDTYIGNAVPLSNGQAQVTTTSLPVNIQQVGAFYSGDTNYATSNVEISETVSPGPTFTVTANPTTVTVNSPGQSQPTTLTFTAENGFSSNGTVTVNPVCTGMPAESSCSSGAMITIATNGTATATLTFNTTAPSSAIPAARNRPNISGWRTAAESALALACLLCAGMLALGYRGKQRRWGLAVVFTMFVLLAVSAGCGGGGSGGGGGGGGVGNAGTPAGQFNPVVNITINGVTEAVPNLVLQVN
jgi:hypothetical protein